ncbi:MAG: ABC transporter ATP-binding protein [Bacteroidota bacterium]|nr:ABC transporter ATP-binding protein [Bacteroidota bacterium]
MSNNAIEIKNLYFSYENKSILSNLNAHFPTANFSVLLGVNGCGKSTLMKILAGLLRPSKGQITFFDKIASEMNAQQKAQTVGFLSQDFQSVFPLSVQDILLTGRGAFSRFDFSKKDTSIVQTIAQKLDLEPLLQEPFNTLSGGQQQRVLIGRILVQNPKIIILDEPTNHLDIYHKHQLLKYLKTLTLEGYTIIAVMHDPTLAYQYADYVYFIQNSIITPTNTLQPINLELINNVFGTEFVSLYHNNQPFIVSKKI